MVARDIEALIDAGLDQLERLALSLQNSSEFPVAPGFPPTAGDLWRLLSGEGLIALRELEISGPVEGDVFAERMARSSLAPTLRVLGIGNLSDVGLEHLIVAADRHPQLERLDVHLRSYSHHVFQRVVDAWGPERVRRRGRFR